MSIRLIPIILASLAVVACTDLVVVGHDSVELRTDRTAYALGERGELTLSNRRRDEVGFNRGLCPLYVEERIGGGWRSAAEQFREVCTLALDELPPGRSTVRSFRISSPPFRPGGEYRLVVGVEDRRTAEAVVVYSNAFRVED